MDGCIVATGKRRGHGHVEKCGHLGIARAGRPSTHHDADDAAPTVIHRRHDVEAGSVRVAGLDAVHAAIAIHQPVMTMDRAARKEKARVEKRRYSLG